VFGASATQAQVGALTATRDIYEDRSGNFQSYGDILGQLNSNPIYSRTTQYLNKDHTFLISRLPNYALLE
jgi:hypothetical protein